MNKIKIIFIVSLVLVLTGCASGARMENMVYSDSSNKSYAQQLKQQVQVSGVQGGKKTNPAWKSEISNDMFRLALKQSLATQGLLSESGRYSLNASLDKIDQPLFGLDFTVTTYIKYTLTDTQTNKTVFEKTVIAPYTATVGDAFMGVERLRLANEGSGKKNIENLLTDLTKLDFKDIAVN